MLSMKTPNTRGEFERNFHLLHRKMELGQLQFSANAFHTLEGLEQIRYLPNGRIDFLSVDESARLQANTMNSFPESLDELEKPPASSDLSRGATNPPAADPDSANKTPTP